jgi:hypothetical protein
VVSALLRFRAEQFGAGRVRELFAELMAFELPELATERVDMGRFVALRVLELLAKNAEPMLGPRRPIADPGRPLAVNGNLEELVASGLGFDLAAVQERSAALGMVAALEQTAVPLALKAGQEPNQDSALRVALQGELARVLNVAAPAPFRTPSPARAAAKRSRARSVATPKVDDPLDLLIARAVDDSDAEETP